MTSPLNLSIQILYGSPLKRFLYLMPFKNLIDWTDSAWNWGESQNITFHWRHTLKDVSLTKAASLKWSCVPICWSAWSVGDSEKGKEYQRLFNKCGRIFNPSEGLRYPTDCNNFRRTDRPHRRIQPNKISRLLNGACYTGVRKSHVPTGIDRHR